MQTAAPEAPVTASNHQLLINSLVAALIGQIGMILVHEIGHFVAGLALGHPSTLYAFGVTHEGDASGAHVAIMAMAGPVLSLVTGLAMIAWQPFRPRNNFAHLVWLFFAFCSVQEMVGYLMIAPFGAGDTAETIKALELPIAFLFISCALGVAGTFANARAFAPNLARYGGADRARRNAFAFFPWLYASIISAVLSAIHLIITPAEFPVGAMIVVMVANTAILIFAPMANIFLKQVAHVPREALHLPQLPVAGIVILAGLVVTNLLLSLFGLRLG